MHARRVILLVTCIFTLFFAFCLAEIPPQANKKMHRQERFVFEPMIRYGRNSNLKLTPTDDEQKFRMMVQTRWGKRSVSIPKSLKTPHCGYYEDMACGYTGVSNIYRCVLRKEVAERSRINNN